MSGAAAAAALPHSKCAGQRERGRGDPARHSWCACARPPRLSRCQPTSAFAPLTHLLLLLLLLRASLLGGGSISPALVDGDAPDQAEPSRIPNTQAHTHAHTFCGRSELIAT